MKKQLNIWMEVELHRKLKAKAALEGKSIVKVTTELVKQYVEEAVDESVPSSS